MIITARFRTIILAATFVAGVPNSIMAESDRAERQVARIFINSMSETAKKLTEKIPLGPLFALQSRIAKDCVDNYISLEDQSAPAKALETLLPVALAHAARTSQENMTNKKAINPFYNKKLARDLILKSSLSTIFVEKGTAQYQALCKLRRLSSFFNADVLVNPTNYKKHFNWVQGVSIWTGEKIAAYAIIPVIKRSTQLDDIQAKMIAEWLVEDIFDKQIADIVETTSNILFNFSANVGIANNFHCVQEGKLYRCRKLSGQEFEKYIKLYGIKTVLNLLGVNPDEPWYQDEVAVLKKLNVKLVSIPLTVSDLPTREQVRCILDTFNEHGPILVHCRVGADRTGLVSALWMLEKMGSSIDNALKQQTIHFGHFGYIWYRWPAMRQFTKIWNNLKNQYGDNTDVVLAHYDPA